MVPYRAPARAKRRLCSSLNEAGPSRGGQSRPAVPASILAHSQLNTALMAFAHPSWRVGATFSFQLNVSFWPCQKIGDQLVMPVQVYGFIEGFGDPGHDAHNLAQIQTLPVIRAYLISPMFSLVQQGAHAYYGGHVHFAAGYKELYCLDADWIDEFESLLSRLYWSRAVAVVAWSQERYVWTSDYSSESHKHKPNSVVGRARFECAWNLKEIAWNS